MNAPSLSGETVVVSYLADLQVGHGAFLLENPRNAPGWARVTGAWLVQGDERTPLPGVSVFDRDTERALDPDALPLPPEGRLRFFLGFPPVAVVPRRDQPVGVELTVDVEGVAITAVSRLQLVRRIPGDR